ncbi:NEL-type E3 ubiquitin ligase domain-containing protein [Noviherbaspirillum sp.]|uniref:NEL-type E3 ubiquitin ligase domain-containing protein n=1 Tax=Noviherbaspirillum sp. TaxID=1926288 RepID=UPI0025E044D9|nr:NEL-type E3 ubiquitin ligase domain-containing protein [Noviherbaspirillum sp.]
MDEKFPSESVGVSCPILVISSFGIEDKDAAGFALALSGAAASERPAATGSGLALPLPPALLSIFTPLKPMSVSHPIFMGNPAPRRVPHSLHQQCFLGHKINCRLESPGANHTPSWCHSAMRLTTSSFDMRNNRPNQRTSIPGSPDQRIGNDTRPQPGALPVPAAPRDARASLEQRTLRPHPEQQSTNVPASLSAPREINRAAHLSSWNAWAQARTSTTERRDVAVERLAGWLAHNDPSVPLDLSGLQLSSLPARLPSTVQNLTVSGNHLTILTPGSAPQLRHLDAANNMLIQLSQLPRSLRSVNLSDNNLRYLPIHISGLHPECSINLEGNPLPDRLRNNLMGLNEHPSYHGPRFYFSSLEWAFGASGNRLEQMLDQTASTLYPPIDMNVAAMDVDGQAPGALAPEAPRERTREEYFAEWDAWAEQPCGSDEHREEAVDRMKDWFDEDNPNSMLDLTELGLTSTPPSFPPTVTRLDIARNALVEINVPFPEGLLELDISDNPLPRCPDVPDGLEKLVATNNDFTEIHRLPGRLQYLEISGTPVSQLPELPGGLHTLIAPRTDLSHLPPLPEGMEDIDITGCNFRQIPSPLPPRLQVLEISENEIEAITELLPTQLENVDLSGNQLTTVPEWLASRLGSHCAVDLGNNPLSEETRAFLERVTSAENYNGPQFFISEGNEMENEPRRPLSEAIGAWFEDESVAERWSEFQGEQGAAEFSQFLVRLRGTVNYSIPAFRQSVTEWLSDLANRPELRKQSFLVSHGATDSCEDRVALTYNEMKKARLNADVEEGRYDQRLGELIEIGRGMFRLDVLEKVSQEKVKSLRLVDEIEVYLAFQVMLRDRLDLPVDTEAMRFFASSYVTQDDLAAAEHLVKEKENKEFVNYLSTSWQPWQSVLKRLAGEQFERTHESLVEAMDEPFRNLLDTRLREHGLQDDPDARREMGKQVKDEIAHGINGRMTTEFLQSRGLAATLAQRWMEE